MNSASLSRPILSLAVVLLLVISLLGSGCSESSENQAAKTHRKTLFEGLVHQLSGMYYFADTSVNHIPMSANYYSHQTTRAQQRSGAISAADSSKPVGAKAEFDSTAYKRVGNAKLDYEVFGWHPHWMGDAYKAYNFDLLTSVAYFSYEVDPATGNYKNIYDWETTGLVEAGQAKGCKVLLAVNNFGSTANATFLGNTAAQTTCINELVRLIEMRKADGVSIDFEQVPGQYKAEWNTFLLNLAKAIHDSDPDDLVSLTLMPVDPAGTNDFEKLEGAIDVYVMMGYDYYGGFSKTSGPIDPLRSGDTWWNWNLERSVNEYIKQGLKPKDLLVAIPYYGAVWETESTSIPSNSKKFIGHLAYHQLVDSFDNRGTIDTSSQCAYIIETGASGEVTQVWYDNEQSLEVKYKWMKEKGLAGAAIWALGYDNGHPEFWQLLEDEFTSTEQGVAGEVFTSFKRETGVWSTISGMSRHRTLWGIAALALLLSIGGAFVLRILREQASFGDHPILIGALVLFLLIIILWFAGVDQRIVIMAVGILFGAIATIGILHLVQFIRSH